jgi:hypothetical protein
MIPYHLESNKATAEKFGLKIEGKTGWREGILPQDMVFVHAANVTPDKVRAFGLSPMYANEYLMDEKGNQLGAGKMVFAMVEGSSNAVVKFFWGNVRHTYKFKAPKGTRFFTQNGIISTNKEVAFPYIIERSDIISGL